MFSHLRVFELLYFLQNCFTWSPFHMEHFSLSRINICFCFSIRMCFLPIIFIGTVTNILNFLVLSKREMRCLSTSVYLSALAVADLGVMYIELFRVWFEWMDIIAPETYFTDVYCKVCVRCVFILLCASVCLIYSSLSLLRYCWDKIN